MIKDVRGWQFLKIEVAETSCMVCLPPGEYIFRKKYLGSKSQICVFTDPLETVK